MPEGDVVWRTAQRLDAALSGRVLDRAELRWPSLATADLTGRTVLETRARGKHLLTRLDAFGDEPPLTLHSHLRMEGSWRIDRSGGGRRLSHDVRAVLGNGEWTAIGTRLGMLDLVRTADEPTLVGHLGPDVLGPDWDLDRVLVTLAADPARPIGAALLDQRVLAGVGTFYMTETMFLVGTSPWTPVGELTAAKRQGAVDRGLPPAPPEPRPGRPGDDGRRPARTRSVRPRPLRAPVPAVRHDDPGGSHRGGASGSGRVLLPELSARTGSDRRRPAAASPRVGPRGQRNAARSSD